MSTLVLYVRSGSSLLTTSVVWLLFGLLLLPASKVTVAVKLVPKSILPSIIESN